MKYVTSGILCLFYMQLLSDVTAAVKCFSCQYSEGPVGYECVTSPADYTQAANTVDCPNGCQTKAQSINDWSSIWFLARGCKTEAGGCTSGSQDICETCDGPDLCNDKNYQPSTVSVGSTESTTPSTTTTEIPGTRSCHSCVYSYHPDEPAICVEDADNVPPPNTVRCPPSRACFIFRQWDKGNNVVRSFSRGCEEQQGRTTGCLEDTFFVTCNTFCAEEFCNSGDGTVPPDYPPLPIPKNG